MKRVIAVILTIALLLTSPAVAEENKENDNNMLVVATLTTMNGNFFDEAFGGNTSDADVRTLIHGYQLTRWNSETGSFGIDHSVVSGIAGTQNPDGSITYLVNIYSDLLYSDGTPITAYDYAFTMLLYASPEFRSLGAGTTVLDFVAGVQEYRNGQCETISGIRVISDTQINITIDGKYLPFFYDLGVLGVNPYPIQEIAPGCRVIDTEEGICFEDQEAFTAELLADTLLDEDHGYISHPSITSGPYVLVSWDQEKQTAEFEVNPYYKGDYQGIKPGIDRLTYLATTDAEVVAKLENGSIGLLTKATLADTISQGISHIADGRLRFANYTRTGLTVISFNCEKDTVSESVVRQALAMCFDRDRFASAMTGNYGIRTDGYYGMGQWMYRLVNEELTMEDEEQQNKLDALSLDGLNRYELNPSAAAELLERNGWTLNADGVREKDGVVLDLLLYTAEESGALTMLQECFAAHAEEAGIRITVRAVPGTDLLSKYYRQTERDNDMFFLGTNFSEIFDPSLTFSPAEEDQGMANRTGLKDDRLYELAVAMHRTKAGDVAAYCADWVAFQEYFTQVLPMIPIYSNVYFDFYTPELHNYQISANISWASAVIEAYLGDTVEIIE